MGLVTLEVKDHIGIVTLNRPPVNALSVDFNREIMNVFDEIEYNEDIWVAILKSECRMFSAGADIKEFNKVQKTDSEILYNSALSVYESRVPVIGAINGKCLGGGICYAASCDIIIASEDACFGIPEITVGVVGGPSHLSRLVPQMLLRYMGYTGRLLTAKELQSYGSVLKVVPNEQLFISALELAEELRNKGPLALKYWKDTMRRQEDFQFKEKNDIEIKNCRRVLRSEDSKEAVMAFIEKRKPRFSGR